MLTKQLLKYTGNILLQNLQKFNVLNVSHTPNLMYKELTEERFLRNTPNLMYKELTEERFLRNKLACKNRFCKVLTERS